MFHSCGCFHGMCRNWDQELWKDQWACSRVSRKGAMLIARTWQIEIPQKPQKRKKKTLQCWYISRPQTKCSFRAHEMSGFVRHIPHKIVLKDEINLQSIIYAPYTTSLNSKERPARTPVMPWYSDDLTTWKLERLFRWQVVITRSVATNHHHTFNLTSR